MAITSSTVACESQTRIPCCEGSMLVGWFAAQCELMPNQASYGVCIVNTCRAAKFIARLFDAYYLGLLSNTPPHLFALLVLPFVVMCATFFFRVEIHAGTRSITFILGWTRHQALKNKLIPRQWNSGYLPLPGDFHFGKTGTKRKLSHISVLKAR